ncbi:hypothetical protein ABLE93_06675 [Xanthobacter sp. KR7-65]|uniref:hypothetical protein n=1 Tax=Xanthobacter sp. KR7-65 TaxID=3156612 RepID=UPI0032B5188A
MATDDIHRLKADASGNTGLSEVLAEAVGGFSSTEDAVRFLATRGFDVTASDLAAAANEPVDDEAAEEGDGYGTLMKFVRHN